MSFRLFIIVALAFSSFSVSPAVLAEEDDYTEEEIGEAVAGFFGDVTEGLAKVIEKVFEDLGQPNAYIVGSEGSGALVVGAVYGKGELVKKGSSSRTVYWQSLTIGFDAGGNAAKVFTLIYNLDDMDDLFQRFPAVDGSLYWIGGAGVNYQRKEGITLAPVRVGVGLRAGVNIGVMRFSKRKRYLPF